MSGPGGTSTKRDQRRESRRDQYQRRQFERQRERQRQIRNKQFRQWGIIGAGVVVFLLVTLLIVNGLTRGSQTGGSNQPATGQTVDNISCDQGEHAEAHYHAYLKVYINGQQQEASPGIGIPGNCIYWLHVHEGQANIIHVEAPKADKFTLANFYHIWGQQIGGNKFMGNTVDDKHSLITEVLDVNGKVIQTVNGDPSGVVIADHQTIVVRYNSPNVKPAGYDWSKFNG